MISDEFGKALHDRSTRGEALSEEEQMQLESWYESQDHLESKLLGDTKEEKTISKLQSQIEVALTQLVTKTNRVQEIASENELLRKDINNLRRQLANSSTVQQTT